MEEEPACCTNMADVDWSNYEAVKFELYLDRESTRGDLGRLELSREAAFARRGRVFRGLPRGRGRRHF